MSRVSASSLLPKGEREVCHTMFNRDRTLEYPLLLRSSVAPSSTGPSSASWIPSIHDSWLLIDPSSFPRAARCFL